MRLDCWPPHRNGSNSPNETGGAFSHSCAFDFSVWEIWGALVHGGRLVVVPYWVSRSPEAFYEILAERRVTVLNQTPSAFRQLLRVVPSPEALALRWVVFGGESLDPRSLRPWLGRGGHRPPCLVNMYGITETTVHVTHHLLTAADCESASRVVGRALPDFEVHVLDRFLRPVPMVVAGELSIGGAGLSRGYLRRPAATAERFVAHLWSREPGTRLYRSGDLGRFLPDGRLEFLGRIDHQVKVRGFRIELGEIEAVLVRHSGVREAVVVAPEGRLVACVVPVREAALSRRELHDFLREQLPDYMLPQAFAMLDRLPLLPNGKVDRAALALDPARETPAGPELDEGALSSPRTPAEEILVGIWAEVLGVSRLGIHDNFFELGGHSLLATRVLSRVRASFSVEIPIRRLFEAPTVAELCEDFEAARGTVSTQSPVIRPVARDGELPLSFAQERLWFLDQLEGPNYNVPAAVHLTGALHVGALELSLREIVRRHEALRTTFLARDGRAVQVIAAQSEGSIPVIELADLPSARLSEELRRLAGEEARRPFDLGRGPLFRATLLRAGGEEHVLLLAFHHIVCDGWSIDVFLRELAALYMPHGGRHPAPRLLPALPVQYADFAHWQRTWLQGEVLEAQLAYWTRQLAGIPTLPALPTDRPRPALRSFRGRAERRRSGPRLTAELKRLSRRSGASLFMSLQAAFAMLLSRYSAQDDVVVGSPVANRQHREIEPLIGFFVNTLVLVTDLSGDPTFHELLDRVRRVALDAYTHQDLPFERLVEALQPDRSLSHAPIFQVMFAFQDMPPSPRLPGLTLRFSELEQTVARFDLTLSMTAAEQGLTATWAYGSDLFEATTVRRMAGHFEALLSGLVADPEAQTSTLPMTSDAEQHQVLVAWNDPQGPEESHVRRLFETWVERTPDAVAVVFDDLRWDARRLTYGELDARANRLAHRLGSLGVGPSGARSEVLVGLAVERSPERAVGFLAVLKAGGVYVPLDPEYPKARLAFMLEDARAGVLVAREPFLSSELAVPVVGPDPEPEGSCESPPQGGSGEELAYVIYTSGSTGKPKGVGLAQRGLAHLAATQMAAYGVQPGSRVIQFAPASFDASIAEMARTLGSGATLCLATADALLPGRALARLLREQEITHLTVPPSALALLPEKDLPALQVLIVGGEAVSPELAARWCEGRRFFNAYGPTEATVCATFAEYTPDHRHLRPPIGRPAAHNRTYVVDRRLRPVPAGVPGELHIGGPALARGYLGRPALTAAKFVPHPWSGERGAERLYKTGDLTRYRNDGNVEFLGRIDQQVKVRGFRIEPGEVEAALARHPDVRGNGGPGRAGTAGGLCGSRDRLAAKRPRAAPLPRPGAARVHGAAGLCDVA